MSLFGALSLGGSSLSAQQTGLQVTGNNIANAGTDGYSRQVASLSPTGTVELSNGQFIGNGVGVQSIQRQVSDSLNESLRNATSNQSGSQTTNTLLTQLQTTFGALNDNDLSSQMTSFFNGFQTLATNPTDSAQRSIVVENGVSLAGSLQTLRSQLTTTQTGIQSQIGTDTQQANSLLTTIANLNGQIQTTEGGGGTANALRDQRDQALTQLSQLINIRTVNPGNGNLNVYVGSMPLVQGNTTRGLSSKLVTNAAGTSTDTEVVFGDNGDPLQVTGGTIGSLISTRDNFVTPAIQTVDTLAAGLISAVNSIHTQGQGTAGFSSVTGTTQVKDPTLALNASTATTGIQFPPTNGTFNFYITNKATGTPTAQQISVNLSGTGTQTTLNSLAASITAAGGGTVTASVTTTGQLAITSSDPNVTFGFGDDTSGVLSAVGVNTFFSGSNAQNIAVNQTLQNNSDLLATGRGNSTGSSQNATALALAGTANVAQLGGQSLNDYYAGYIGNLATQAQSASDDVSAQGLIHDTLSAQQQSLSGVSMDEETINLTKYQRAFEGSARFITVVDQMMQTVLALIT